MSASAPARLLAALASVLDANAWRWYVFGAQAVSAWGRPRMTADVDVTVRLGEAPAARLVSALAAARFRLRVTDAAAFVARTRVLPFVHEPTAFPVDIVLAGAGIEDLFLDRAVRIDVGGVVVPVICAEDLIVTKILAGRPKDIEDVRGILAERGEASAGIHPLDIKAVRETLSLLEQAIGQSDLTPRFDALLADGDSLRSRVPRPPTPPASPRPPRRKRR